MQLEGIHFFELWHFGLEEDHKALPICLEDFPVIVLESDGTVIGGI
jgi:hypothetical protein